MDHLSGGRFQSPSPQKPTREVANRTASAASSQPRPSTPATSTYQSGQSSLSPDKPSNKKKILLSVIAAIVLLALIAGTIFFLRNGKSTGAGIDDSKYQAVFFTNGQVYFGKLHDFSSESLKMTDIFYLQAQADETKTDTKNPQNTATEQGNNVQLIKLGQEVHGPEDEMIISKDQVLFYENLKSDGKVAQSIAQYKQQ